MKQIQIQSSHNSKISQSSKKQTARTPYRHTNYKKHFDQRYGQNEDKQRSYDIIKERKQNQQTKHKTRSFIQQSDKKTTTINIDLGWATSQTMRHFSWEFKTNIFSFHQSVTVLTQNIER